MSSRNLNSRLDKLIKALNLPEPDVAVCRYHEKACRLGARWPLPWPVPQQEAELIDLVRQAKINTGKDPGPHPRALWELGAHQEMTAAEIAERERELAELIAKTEADNDRLMAELLAERDNERGTDR